MAIHNLSDTLISTETCEGVFREVVARLRQELGKLTGEHALGSPYNIPEVRQRMVVWTNMLIAFSSKAANVTTRFSD
jgi:hypothetical protein